MVIFKLGITVKSFCGWRDISSDEDKDARRGIVNSNTNNIVYQSTESSYELPFKDKPSNHGLAHDHE